MDQKVLVALSGGVDSAVAAALLVEEGFQVFGITLQLWRETDEIGDAPQRARRVAQHLNIPFTLLNAEEQFKREIAGYFIYEYAAGRTPNPCVRCNQALKLKLLTEYAATLQIHLIATGHYARVHRTPEGYELLRGIDRHKDQSYFLHMLTQKQLSRLLFPVGTRTKEEVRAIAHLRGLPVAQQPESQDICFIPGGNYRQFIARYAPDLCQPGPIYNSSGQLLGQHQGCPAYTIGQRRGLGISAPQPLYVLAIDPTRNAIIVGPADELGRNECYVKDIHYISAPRTGPFQALAQIRYRAKPTPVIVTPNSDGIAHVHFRENQRDITPGQFLVLYDNETVLGGGTICNVSEPCYNISDGTR